MNGRGDARTNRAFGVMTFFKLLSSFSMAHYTAVEIEYEPAVMLAGLVGRRLRQDLWGVPSRIFTVE